NLGPCTGELGSGRINAFRAFDKSILSVTISDKDFVLNTDDNQMYFIAGGQKQPVSYLVYLQRFSAQTPKKVTTYDLSNFPTGPYALPNEGTIVKAALDPTVYQISGGQKLPLTAQIFKQRGLTNADIMVLGDVEVNSWITGKFMPPTEGTLVKSPNNP